MNRIMYVIFLSIATSSLFSDEKKALSKPSATLVLNSKYPLPSGCSDDFMASHGPFLVAASPGDQGTLKLYGLGKDLGLLDTLAIASFSSNIKDPVQQLRIVRNKNSSRESLAVVVRRPGGVQLYSLNQQDRTTYDVAATFFAGALSKLYSTVVGDVTSKSESTDDDKWDMISDEETSGGETSKANAGSVTPQRSVSGERLLGAEVGEKLDTEGHVDMDPNKKWCLGFVGSVSTPPSKDMTLVKTSGKCALWIVHAPQNSEYSTVLSEVQLRENSDGSLRCMRESLSQSWDEMLRKYFALDTMAAISANKKIVCFAGKSSANKDRVVGCDLKGELKLIVDRNEQIPKLMDSALFAALVAYLSLSRDQADEIKNAIAQLHQGNNKVLSVLQQRYILTEQNGAIVQQQYDQKRIRDGLCMFGNTKEGATCHNNCVVAGSEVHVFPSKFDNQSTVLSTPALSEKGLADLADEVNGHNFIPTSSGKLATLAPSLVPVGAPADQQGKAADEQIKTEQKKEDQQQAASAAPTTNANDNLVGEADEDKELATSSISSLPSVTDASVATVPVQLPIVSSTVTDASEVQIQQPDRDAKCICGKTQRKYKNCCGKLQ